MKVSRLFFSKSFASQQADFKVYPELYRQPMEGSEQRQAGGAGSRFGHNTCQAILDTLQFIEMFLGSTKENGITVVKAAGHQ